MYGAVVDTIMCVPVSLHSCLARDCSRRSDLLAPRCFRPTPVHPPPSHTHFMGDSPRSLAAVGAGRTETYRFVVFGGYVPFLFMKPGGEGRGGGYASPLAQGLMLQGEGLRKRGACSVQRVF
jgi:hypothetical protein